jgi:hypothetical protein
MNKITGPVSDYAPLRDEGSRITICYGLQQPEQADQLASWYEVYLYKRQHATVTLQDVKQAVLADINARTDEKILSGFVWTPLDGEPIPVWLSTENQFNFKSAYDLAVQKQGATLPVTFKMGEHEDGTPVYHTFETMDDADDFYLKAVAYINQTLAAGWQEKDGIDWSPYEALFPQTDGQGESVTE